MKEHVQHEAHEPLPKTMLGLRMAQFRAAGRIALGHLRYDHMETLGNSKQVGEFLLGERAWEDIDWEPNPVGRNPQLDSRYQEARAAFQRITAEIALRRSVRKNRIRR